MTTKTDGENLYSTSDLALAAAISILHPVEAIDKANPRKALFIFKSTSKLLQTVEMYWRGELKVDPKEYFNALKNLKGRLYE